jgi:hypothetical protein
MGMAAAEPASFQPFLIERGPWSGHVNQLTRLEELSKMSVIWDQ